jgi:hypothetical protein
LAADIRGRAASTSYRLVGSSNSRPGAGNFSQSVASTEESIERYLNQRGSIVNRVLEPEETWLASIPAFDAKVVPHRCVDFPHASRAHQVVG